MNNKQALTNTIAQLFSQYARYCEDRDLTPTKTGFMVWAKNQ
jgi:hypothetical protein